MWTTTDTLILWAFWSLPALCVLVAGLAYWIRNRSNDPRQSESGVK
jgi:hypothetical protein